MNRETIPPGRELDALVAKRIMETRGRKDWDPRDKRLCSEGYLPPYSTDIAAAWGLVEQEFFSFPIEKLGDEYIVDLGVGKRVRGKTAPHAISLAVLETM